MTIEEEETPREEIIPGVARALSPLVRRIHVPGGPDGRGTNTYLVGIDEIAVIDPGPVDADHLVAISGCGGDCLRWVMVTGADPHLAEGAKALKDETGVDILVPSWIEGVDGDRALEPGETITGTEFRLTVHDMAGASEPRAMYMLEEERTLFCGDLLREDDESGEIVPDGVTEDLAAALEMAHGLRLKRIAPAHGHTIEDPGALLESL